MKTLPQFSFKLENIADDLYRLDVVCEHLPKNFLGTAFDIVMNKDFKYENFQPGTVFESPKNTIALAVQKDQHIIFGISLKRGFAVKNSKGVVASFHVHLPAQGKLELGFTNGILSIFDRQRKDLASIVWEKSAVMLEDIKKNKSVILAAKGKTNAGNEAFAAISGPDENIASSKMFSGIFASPIWIIPLVISLILAIVARLITKQKRQQKQATKQND